MKLVNLNEKKKKQTIHVVKDAGNVEYNVGMFNKMANPTSSPSTSPVGMMGESVIDKEKQDIAALGEAVIEEVNQKVPGEYEVITCNVHDGKVTIRIQELTTHKEIEKTIPLRDIDFCKQQFVKLFLQEIK